MLKHDEWKNELLEREVAAKEEAIKKESDYLDKWIKTIYIPIMDEKLIVAIKNENTRHELIMGNLKEEAEMVAGISFAMKEANEQSKKVSGIVIGGGYVGSPVSYSGNDGYVPDQNAIKNGITVKPSVTNNYNITADGKSAVEIADEILKQQTLAAEGIE